MTEDASYFFFFFFLPPLTMAAQEMSPCLSMKYRKPASGSAIDAVATIKAAEKKDVAAMEKAHRGWWHEFYPASFERGRHSLQHQAEMSY